MGIVKLYILQPLFLKKGSSCDDPFCIYNQATNHLCFFTLYRGMKGSRMGTVVTYF